jgi:hypothetical protein
MMQEHPFKIGDVVRPHRLPIEARSENTVLTTDKDYKIKDVWTGQKDPHHSIQLDGVKGFFSAQDFKKINGDDKISSKKCPTCGH